MKGKLYQTKASTSLFDEDGSSTLTATVTCYDPDEVETADPSDFVTLWDMEPACDLMHTNKYGDRAYYGTFGHNTYGVVFEGFPEVTLCARGGLDAASRLARKFHSGWRPINWPVKE